MIPYQSQATREANNKRAAEIMAEKGKPLPGIGRNNTGGAEAIERKNAQLAQLLASRNAG